MFSASDGVEIESPLHTVDFLSDFNKIMETKFTATTMDECMDSAGIPPFDLVSIECVGVFFLIFFHVIKSKPHQSYHF